MVVSPWWALVATVPVLLVGEAIVRRVRVLSAFSIPVAVVGGLVVAVAVLAVNVSGAWEVSFGGKVAARWWTWVVTAEPAWWSGPMQPVHQPLVVAFFTCVGLNASWSVTKRGSKPVLVFCVVAGLLAVVQNAVGVGLAKAMDQSPMLGLLCGSVSLTGGPGTAMGFASNFEEAGFSSAGSVGAAAATFGIVAGSLLGGPVAVAIIRLHRIEYAGDGASSGGTGAASGVAAAPRSRLLAELAALGRLRGSAVVHVLILLACVKVGAWVSYGLSAAGLTFPVHIGAMTVGILVRNGLDAMGLTVLKTDAVNLLASLLLSVFLAFAIISLNLAELLGTALPMLAILAAQAVLTLAFAYAVTFTIMGRNYEAAVISAGHVGFGLGVTSNAIASMESIMARFGPSPQAFLVVVLVGAYLNDFTNALNITWFLNLLR